MRSFLLTSLLFVPALSLAGSITAPGVIGGLEAGAANADPSGVHHNPATIATLEGTQALLDVETAIIHVDATTTRNDGIDPLTGQAYNPATADAMVPVFFLGLTHQVIPDKLTIGFAATDSFVGGGDYTSSESNPPPYLAHQRYAGINVKIITISLMPSVGFTATEGLHFGAGLHYVMDAIDILQAADPIHSEGAMFTATDDSGDILNTGDTILQGSGSGGHMAWNAGVFFDKIPQAKIGVSYASGGKWNVSGTSSVDGPIELLPDGSIEGLFDMRLPLPAVLRAEVMSEVSEKLDVGVGFEYQMWKSCCGGPEGDIVIGITDADGNALSTTAGEMATEIYSPRRLRNSANFLATVAGQATDKLRLGLRLGYNTSAVPDYAVSATNLDYQAVGGMVQARYNLGKVDVGLAFSKFFTFERTITNSAWDAEVGSDTYVDDRFSPSLPYKANTNGSYHADVNVFGLRLAMAL